MRRLAILGLSLLLAPAALAKEPAPESRALVEIVASNPTPFVNEPIRLTLQFAVDRAFFDAHAVQLFRTELDVPVQVRAPWIDKIPGTQRDAVPASEREQPLRFALNGAAGEAQPVDVRTIEGRAFDFYRVERIVRPLKAGAIELAAPTLRFAHATRFEEDFVGGRVPLDRKDVTLQGKPLTLRVQPLPPDNRPAAFVDAVGQYEIWAEADRAEVDRGETFHLRVHVEGQGNLASLTMPDVRGLPGFHVYATRDQVSDDRRTLRAEIAATRDDVTALPPISFAYFDPGPPAGYVVIATQPQPLSVRPVAADPAPEAARDTATTPEPIDRTWLLVVAALLALIVAAGLWFAARRLRSARVAKPPTAVQGQRIAAASQALAKTRAASAHRQGDALGELIAAHLGCAAAAAVDPGLSARLTAHGFPREDAHEIARALEALVAARYGGPAVELDASVLSRLGDLDRT